MTAADTTVYTDGSYLPATGGAAYAYLVLDGTYTEVARGVVPCPTARSSDTAETLAVTAALRLTRHHPGTTAIRTDSSNTATFCHNGWQAWAAHHPTPTKRGLVAARQALCAELQHPRAGQLTIEWVRGHTADPYNMLCDSLARAAARSTPLQHHNHHPATTTPPPAPAPTPPGTPNSSYTHALQHLAHHLPPQCPGCNAPHRKYSLGVTPGTGGVVVACTKCGTTLHTTPNPAITTALAAQAAGLRPPPGTATAAHNTTTQQP